jgi:hypothetical protein
MATGKDKFWPIDDVAALVENVVGGYPYALANGMKLTVEIDGVEQEVTFATVDFANIAAATAAEVAYVLDRDLDDCRAMRAGVSLQGIKLVTLDAGSSTTLQVTGGTANAVLAFPTTINYGISDGTLSAQQYTQGLAITLSWYLWVSGHTSEGGWWDGQFKILMKQGEYAREHDDSRATTVFSTTYGAGALQGHKTETVTGLTAGLPYYFSFFVYNTTWGVWMYDQNASFAWSYPFGQWGHSSFMFRRSPARDQRNDSDGHWAGWLSLYGTALDGKKTEIEQLKTFYDIPNVRAEFIPQHDYLLGWPTNYELPENEQRDETENVIPLWHKKGRAVSVEFPLEQVSGYDIQLVDGWKYVMLHNDTSCVHPDTTNPALPTYAGRQADLMKYHPDIGGWHDVNGWGVFFLPIEGSSGVLTATMIAKVARLMPVLKDSWVDYSLILENAAVEETPLAPTEECLGTGITLLDEEIPLSPEEEEVALLRPYFAMLHNDVDTLHYSGSGTITTWARHPHADFTFDGDKNLLAAAMFNDDPGPIAIDFVVLGSTLGEDWVETGTLSIVADAGAFGGYALSFDAVNSYLTASGFGFIASGLLLDSGTISLRVKPGYSGTPSADQYFFTIMTPIGNSLLELQHHTGTGLLEAKMTTAAGVSIYTQSAAWSPTAGNWYHFEFNFSDTTGTSLAELFVDGTKLLTGAVSGARGVATHTFIGGSGAILNDFRVDEFLMYNAVKHTANFTPPTTELWGYADVYP